MYEDILETFLVVTLILFATFVGRMLFGIDTIYGLRAVCVWVAAVTILLVRDHIKGVRA